MPKTKSPMDELSLLRQKRTHLYLEMIEVGQKVRELEMTVRERTPQDRVNEERVRQLDVTMKTLEKVGFLSATEAGAGWTGIPEDMQNVVYRYHRLRWDLREAIALKVGAL